MVAAVSPIGCGDRRPGDTQDGEALRANNVTRDDNSRSDASHSRFDYTNAGANASLLWWDTQQTARAALRDGIVMSVAVPFRVDRLQSVIVTTPQGRLLACLYFEVSGEPQTGNEPPDDSPRLKHWYWLSQRDLEAGAWVFWSEQRQREGIEPRPSMTLPADAFSDPQNRCVWIDFVSGTWRKDSEPWPAFN